jgi:hypothetical protein
MAILNWTGGGNNRANNPRDWSTDTAPAAGDQLHIGTLDVRSGPFTLDIRGGDLAGDFLDFSTGLGLGSVDFTANLSHQANVHAGAFFSSGNHTFNLSQNSNLNLNAAHAFATVNVFGTDTATLAEDEGGLTVNLHQLARLIGTVSIQFGAGLQMHGTPGSQFNNNGASLLSNSGHNLIDASVTGYGSFVVQTPSEFGRSVGANQNVLVNNGGEVQIDQPHAFKALALLASGEIDLMGLAQADSYSYRNDMLDIFGGGKVLEHLRFHDATANGFVVENLAPGKIGIASIIDPANPPIGLPVHV